MTSSDASMGNIKAPHDWESLMRAGTRNWISNLCGLTCVRRFFGQVIQLGAFPFFIAWSLRSLFQYFSVSAIKNTLKPLLGSGDTQSQEDFYLVKCKKELYCMPPELTTRNVHAQFST